MAIPKVKPTPTFTFKLYTPDQDGHYNVKEPDFTIDKVRLAAKLPSPELPGGQLFPLIARLLYNEKSELLIKQ